MFCVQCGKQLEKQWKVCPKCGTEVAEQQEEDIVVVQPHQIVCEKCGNELQEDWLQCPFCGYVQHENLSQQKEKANMCARKFEFEGFRRTGRFGFQYITSEFEVDGEQINAVVHKKKDEKITFLKREISEIRYPILPVIGRMDMFRIVLFILLAIPLKGMTIFAILFFVKITLVRHMQIKLTDGRKIAVPIRQKAETVEFLKNIEHPENEIQKIATSAVSSSRIVITEWIVSTLMLILAAITIAIGVQSYTNRQNSNITEINKQDDAVRSLEDIGGYEAWVESEYASKVRTDIVVMLPVTQREADTYAVKICTSLGDVIYIKQADGSLATEWEWLMNAVPDVEAGDTATFQATLTKDGYTMIDGEKPIPIFVAEDIEGYFQQSNEAEIDDAVEEGKEEVSQNILENQNNFAIINDYVHGAGYVSLESGYCVYFDRIEDNKLIFRIIQENILVVEDSATIVNNNTAEYKTENGQLIFEFDDYSELDVYGYLGPHHLSDTYYGQWS